MPSISRTYVWPINSVITPIANPSLISPPIDSATNMISANISGMSTDVRIILFMLHTPITLHKMPMIIR